MGEDAMLQGVETNGLIATGLHAETNSLGHREGNHGGIVYWFSRMGLHKFLLSSDSGRPIADRQAANLGRERQARVEGLPFGQSLAA